MEYRCPLAEISRWLNQAIVLLAIQKSPIAIQQRNRCVIVSESAIALQLSYVYRKLAYYGM
jgi:hypothetical protein